MFSKPCTESPAWYELKAKEGLSKLDLLKIKKAGTFKVEDCDCDFSGDCFWHRPWASEEVKQITLAEFNIIDYLDKLGISERYNLFRSIFEIYCEHCGSKHRLPSYCQCNNDD